MEHMDPRLERASIGPPRLTKELTVR